MSNRASTYLRQHHLGLIAIFIALSGTAYAADGPLPGQNQVGSQDIIEAEVKNDDVSSNAITTGKIADGHVRTADVLDNGLTGTDVNEGTLGKVPRASSADNAGLLDGKDSTEFVLGRGARISSFGNTGHIIPASSAPELYLPLPPNWGNVYLGCLDVPQPHLFLRFRNESGGGPLDSYLDDGSGDPSFRRIPSFGQQDSPPKFLTGDLVVDHLVWQLVADSGAVATITASIRMQDTIAGTHCHAAMQAVFRD